MKSPDDDLLASLGALAREQEASADAGATSRPKPLDEAMRNRLMAVARAGVQRETDDTSEGPAARLAAPVPASAEPRRARVVVFVAAGTIAMAAAVALYVTSRPQREDVRMVAALPSYELDVAGGIASERGAPERLRLVEGAAITLALRPATRSDEAVEARAWIVRSDVVTPLDLAATVAPGGAVRLAGTLVSGGMAAGPAEIVVSVGRPGARHTVTGTADTQILRTTIDLGAR